MLFVPMGYSQIGFILNSVITQEEKDSTFLDSSHDDLMFMKG